MKKILLKDNIYRSNPILLVGGDLIELQKYINKRHKDGIIIDLGKRRKVLIGNKHTGGKAFTVEGVDYDYFYAWIKKFDWTVNDLSMIAHELLHLTYEVLTQRGIGYSKKSEETIAYFFEEMFNQALRKLNP